MYVHGITQTSVATQCSRLLLSNSHIINNITDKSSLTFDLFYSVHQVLIRASTFITSFFITVVSRKYAPPFATLASVQNAGGAYTRDAPISLAITPPPPPPILPVPIKNDLIVGGDEGQARGGEMLLTLQVG